jgi:hypothetical protein
MKEQDLASPKNQPGLAKSGLSDLKSVDKTPASDLRATPTPIPTSDHNRDHSMSEIEM